MINELITKAIDAVLANEYSFCKFLSANDSGETGGHQSGILISISASSMFFTKQEMRENHILKRDGKIKWQDDYTSSCTITWYESKKELRITRFGKGLSPLRPEYTGALFVMVQESENNYQGFIFNTDEDIQEFLDSFGLTPTETNRLISLHRVNPEVKERKAIEEFIAGLAVDFPSSYEMSAAARMIQDKVHSNHKKRLQIQTIFFFGGQKKNIRCLELLNTLDMEIPFHVAFNPSMTSFQWRTKS